MTAYQLAELLLKGPDVEVHLAYPAGDYWRTWLAPIIGQVSMADVAESAYHRMDTLITDEQDDRTDRRTVIILR